MNEIHHLQDCRITIDRRGASAYTKASYPVHCGVYAEIATPDHTFHFNLNREIIRAAGRGAAWPHPQEWLKRTAGNDWIYYSTGGYTGVYEATGEYYLPNLPYPTNRFLGGEPLDDPAVAGLIDSWHPLLTALRDRLGAAAPGVAELFERALANGPEELARRADRLFRLCGGRISVLPPDTRHVDYNVIPVAISRGCLYKCRFCRVKNDTPFSELSRAEISGQLDRLAELYGDDRHNYNSLFLGEHDALQAAPELICTTIAAAQRTLGLLKAHIRGSNVFLFGSVGSLLGAPDRLFRDLDRLPGNVYINIGLESADQQTLDRLGKPLGSDQVIAAFGRMQELNDTHATVELTGNFVIDGTLPRRHHETLLGLVRDRMSRSRSKGCIYLSPLRFDAPSRSRLFEFYRLKLLSRLPLLLYTIQRL